MKRGKNIAAISFILLLSIMCIFTSTAQAAQKIDLAFDGVRIPVSTSVGLPPADGGTYKPFYLDISAEVSNQRTFLPLRLVSELLGAEVKWQQPSILLTHDKTTIELTIGSNQADKNQNIITLDAAPYIKDNRAMVPIRFIAESFNCQVDYANNLVNIRTTPLTINNIPVAKMARTSKTPEYINVSELKANMFIKNMYQAIYNNHDLPIEEPEYYGDYVNMDPLIYYYSGNDSYTLLDADNNIMEQFVIYTAMINGSPPPSDYAKYLLYDGLTEKWYALPPETYALMQRWNWTATRYGAIGYDNAWKLVD